MSKHPVSFRIGRICRLFVTAGICLYLAACSAPAGAKSSETSVPSGSTDSSGASAAASDAETSAEALPVITVITETVDDGTEPAAENTAAENPSMSSAADGTFTITFAGDILMDPGYSAGDALTKRGAEGSFDEEALSIMRNADLFVVNNEFAFTSRGTAVSKQYNFRADPKNVQILKDMGAGLVTLGNNHTYDYGEEGLLDTLDTLKAAGVPYIGAGKDLEEASAPAVYTIGGFRISLVNAESILFNSNPPAQCALEGKPGTFDCYRPEMLFEAVRKAKAESDYCIAVLHWGSEGKSTPNEKQLTLSRGAAEAGADLIIGGHPHVLQTIGRVGAVPVVYSLGNYLFHSGTYDTGVIQAVFRPSEKRLESLRFVPMQCRNMKVFTLSGSEKERLLKYMRSLSPEVQIDEDGIIALP
ncbi:MAG: CapA family protein [Stomatobaculum sp.]|nr:CapA family protein [Stomatobaculum sp.]